MTQNGEIAIKVDGIAKRYRIGMKESPHESMTGAIFNLLKSPYKNFKKYRSLYKFEENYNGSAAGGINDHPDIIWALRDITFELKQGEVIGIIGRNGAGKSTLLKILSRITHPTSGSVIINGRMSTLIEVGTGFHPELTGRENVYLNGTILGMTKKEIDKKFDQIVDFSGIEKFLDTPIKRYSSGMTVRLAFSVAAHLQAEIILVDEVLAVGDVNFQNKCIAKMESASNDGRSVLLVSHNMASISRLCSRAILIEDGLIKEDGPADAVVKKYLASGTGTTAEKVWNNIDEAPGGDIARLLAIRAMDEHGMLRENFDIRRPIRLEITYEVVKDGFAMIPHLGVVNEDGTTVFLTLENDSQWKGKIRPRGNYVSRVEIPGNFLSDGFFYVDCYLLIVNPSVVEIRERQIIGFEVKDSYDGDSARGEWKGNFGGVVRPLFDWETRYSVN